MKKLVVSISGIRGVFGNGLDPEVILRYAGGYGTWLRQRNKSAGTRERPLVVIGRDARVTGPVCADLVSGTLRSLGCDVIDAGLATTPTVAMAVLATRASGGIILSASHNPAEWNALKLLNETSEFLSPEQAKEVIQYAESDNRAYATYDKIGSISTGSYLDYHLDQIVALDYIDPNAIAARGFKVVVDGVNSVGGVAIPALLERLGLRADSVIKINCEPSGLFAHDPEPLPGNISELRQAVQDAGADLGIVVDPDADRLALVNEHGIYVTEELTQVIAADFLWRFRPGAYATNLSSSRAIDDVARKYGCSVHRSAVGEINVVKKMQEVEAVLGGEGNGGVILPDLHYGRDALVGVAMVLQHLANEECSLSALCKRLPAYAIAKKKIELGGYNADRLLARMGDVYRDERVSTIDGVKIDLDEGWVHLRKSNTEPVMRIYAEASTLEEATVLADRFMGELLRGGE